MSNKLARFLIRLIVRLTCRIESYGRELLPESGGYVVVANHLGRLDPALVYYYLDRPDVILMVAEKYRTNRLAVWFTRALNSIFVDRFNADFAAVREVLTRLKKGSVLVLAPEGTRSPTEALLEGQPGAAYLASKAGVPIFPAAVTGTEDRLVKAHLKRLRRIHVVLRIGQPFTLAPVRGAEREATLQLYTDEIMCRIAALLPPEYRGVYADHPRLHEYLPAAQALQPEPG